MSYRWQVGCPYLCWSTVILLLCVFVSVIYLSPLLLSLFVLFLFLLTCVFKHMWFLLFLLLNCYHFFTIIASTLITVIVIYYYYHSYYYHCYYCCYHCYCYCVYLHYILLSLLLLFLLLLLLQSLQLLLLPLLPFRWSLSSKQTSLPSNPWHQPGWCSNPQIAALGLRTKTLTSATLRSSQNWYPLANIKKRTDVDRCLPPKSQNSN